MPFISTNNLELSCVRNLCMQYLEYFIPSIKQRDNSISKTDMNIALHYGKHVNRQIFRKLHCNND